MELLYGQKELKVLKTIKCMVIFLYVKETNIMKTLRNIFVLILVLMNSCVCDGASYWTERNMCVFDKVELGSQIDLETAIDIAHDVFFNSEFGNELDPLEIYKKQFVIVFTDKVIKLKDTNALGTFTNYGAYYKIVIVSNKNFPSTKTKSGMAFIIAHEMLHAYIKHYLHINEDHPLEFYGNSPESLMSIIVDKINTEFSE